MVFEVPSNSGHSTVKVKDITSDGLLWKVSLELVILYLSSVSW